MNTIRASIFSACTMLSFSAHATDGELLIVAAQINYIKAVETRCDDIRRGYSRDLQAAYAAAKANMLDEVGLTDQVFAEAASFRELAVAPMVEKFDLLDMETKAQYCKQNLQYIKGAAAAKKETKP